jgi:hypothetical protein
MSANAVQITDEQCNAIGRALHTVPTVALSDGRVLRTGATADHRAVPMLDLDALVRTFVSIGECVSRVLREHEATADELRELRDTQRAMQRFLGTYREPLAPEPGQS